MSSRRRYPLFVPMIGMLARENILWMVPLTLGVEVSEMHLAWRVTPIRLILLPVLSSS
jgi:hypothetical protein